jgi:hypothetical protein
MPAITVLYAGLLGLMSIAVAIPPGKMRTEKGISVGDGTLIIVVTSIWGILTYF